MNPTYRHPSNNPRIGMHMSFVPSLIAEECFSRYREHSLNSRHLLAAVQVARLSEKHKRPCWPGRIRADQVFLEVESVSLQNRKRGFAYRPGESRTASTIPLDKRSLTTWRR